METIKKRIAIIGSTGSIGVQALQVVKAYPELFEVQLISAYNNSRLLIEQAIEFKVGTAIIGNKDLYKEVFDALDPHGISVYAGEESILDAMSSDSNIDLVLTSVVGFCGLEPTLAAIRSGKAVAIANKEPLVAAGHLVMRAAAEHRVPVLPVDSEHSAIFQCLQGEISPIERIYLTASGGPFLRTPVSEMQNVSVAEAINHPRWKMGKKITVDSATLMNKGFEMIEAGWLFGVDYSKITVVIHPQSIIHSMVSFADGSIKAQLSSPDMRMPIQYALTYPERKPLDIPRLDFSKLGGFTFSAPDLEKFPCLAMAMEAMKKGGNLPCVMNAADEVAVNAFLNGDLKFLDIPKVIEKCMSKYSHISNPSLEDILNTDKVTREFAKSMIK